jgi:NADH:ubiquinone oxidoreductase subunit 6 (subunit J)
MGIWTWPLIGIITLVGGISLYATLKVMKFEKVRQSANDAPIPEGIKEHPALFNPVIWSYLLAFIFIFTVIFYYIASSR